MTRVAILVLVAHLTGCGTVHETERGRIEIRVLCTRAPDALDRLQFRCSGRRILSVTYRFH